MTDEIETNLLEEIERPIREDESITKKWMLDRLETVCEEIKKSKILESDFQSGEIEFSLTGELVPLEIVEAEFNELKKQISGEKN